MGAGQSTSQDEDQHPSRALHVLRVTPESPASHTSIEPFFDFVVGFEGDALSTHHNIDASELERIVESHEGRTLNLLVWNNKSREIRVVPIIPSRAWSQPLQTAPDPREPESASQPSLLGLSMRMCEPEFAMDCVWHVLDVLEGSPAESAGLVPYGDWIIGWSGGVLSAEGDFYDLVEAHVDKPLRVYVYSHDFDALREVVLVPNRQWGGEGLLGCVFGFGLLHRIPPQPSDRLPGTTPPELQEEEYEEQELFVPADVQPPEGSYSVEQVAEWRRQEQDEWNRESLARHRLYDQTQPQQEEYPSAQTDNMDVSPYETVSSHHHVHDGHDHHNHHDHDHNHDHGHDHDHGPASSANTTPQELPHTVSIASNPFATPSGAASGHLMNGTGTSIGRLFSYSENKERNTSSLGLHSGRSPVQDYTTTSDGSENGDDETSVSGTELTAEMDGESTSQGSLTSVD